MEDIELCDRDRTFTATQDASEDELAACEAIHSLSDIGKLIEDGIMDALNPADPARLLRSRKPKALLFDIQSCSIPPLALARVLERCEKSTPVDDDEFCSRLDWFMVYYLSSVGSATGRLSGLPCSRLPDLLFLPHFRPPPAPRACSTTPFGVFKSQPF